MQAPRKSFAIHAFAMALIGGALIATPIAARANVACNGEGECWNTHPYAVTQYPPGLHVQVYNDEWREKHEHDTQYRWMKNRDDDHGYYSRGEWHAFEK